MTECNHKFTEEKLRELGCPELFIIEARKMHDGYCTTHDFDALVGEIIECWQYAMKIKQEKANEASAKVDG